MIGHYIICFENILVYIFCNFWKIDSVYVKECVIDASAWEHNSSRPEMLYNNSYYKNFGKTLFGKASGMKLVKLGKNACNFINIALLHWYIPGTSPVFLEQLNLIWLY